MKTAPLSDNATPPPPAISWLVCAHVANKQLREALESCFTQEFKDFECILVLNGDNVYKTSHMVKTWFRNEKRLRIFETDVKHLTFSLALGLHHSRGGLIARMDSDDISTPDRLAKQYAYMMSHPDVAVLGSEYERIDDSGNTLETIKLPHDNISIRKALKRGNPICHPSVMFRREIALRVGGYLGGIYAQDYDLWLRIADDPKSKFANLPSACLKYRATAVGKARGARLAYASMASSQIRNLLIGKGWSWGYAATITVIKAFLKANR